MDIDEIYAQALFLSAPRCLAPEPISQETHALGGLTKQEMADWFKDAEARVVNALENETLGRYHALRSRPVTIPMARLEAHYQMAEKMCAVLERALADGASCAPEMDAVRAMDHLRVMDGLPTTLV